MKTNYFVGRILCLVLVMAVVASGSLWADEAANSSGEDHQAKVFDVKGDSKILKPKAGDWAPVTKGLIIEAGDQVLTGIDSYVDVVYDDQFLNIARIDANTKAEFRSIEPTDLHMEDGTIFSALDGLKGGSSYQVSTPTAVAAVRGTHLFTEAAGGKFESIAVIPDEKPYESHVEVDINGEKKFDVVEGLELKFNAFGAGEVGAIDPSILEKTGKVLENIPVEKQDVPEAATSDSVSKEEDQEKESDDAGLQDPNKKGDDRNKPMNPPGGGGGPGGGSGGGKNGPDMGRGNDAGNSLRSVAEKQRDMGTGMIPDSANAMPEEIGAKDPKNLDALADRIADSVIPMEGFQPGQPGQRPEFEGRRPMEGQAMGDRSGNPTTAAAASNFRPASAAMPMTDRGPAAMMDRPAPRPVSADGFMNFLSVGGFGMQNPSGANATGGSPERYGEMARGMMTNLGFDTKTAEQFGERIGEAAGRIQTSSFEPHQLSFMTSGVAATPQGFVPMPAGGYGMMPGGMPPPPMGSAEGPNFEDFRTTAMEMGAYTDPNSYVHDKATDGFIPPPPTFIEPVVNPNPLYVPMHFSLSDLFFFQDSGRDVHNATAIYEAIRNDPDKDILWSNASPEVRDFNPSGASHEIVGNFIADDINMGLEKIVGLRFTADGENAAGDKIKISAYYDSILRAGDSSVLEPPPPTASGLPDWKIDKVAVVDVDISDNPTGFEKYGPAGNCVMECDSAGGNCHSICT